MDPLAVLEERFNESVEGQELDEEQDAPVENPTNVLTEVVEMTEEAYSPAEIL